MSFLSRSLLHCSVLFAMVLLVASCGGSNDGDDDADTAPATTSGQQRTVTFHSYGFGLFAVNDTLDDAENKYRLLKSTDTIKAKIGNRFGISYLVTNTSDESLDFTRVWMFPGTILDSATGDSITEYRDNVTVSPGSYGHAIYTFERTAELIKGQWELRFYYKNHLMFRKPFWVM